VGRIRATSGIFGFLVTFQEKPLKFQEIENKILIINRVIIERKKKGKKSHDFLKKKKKKFDSFLMESQG